MSSSVNHARGALNLYASMRAIARPHPVQRGAALIAPLFAVGPQLSPSALRARQVGARYISSAGRTMNGSGPQENTRLIRILTYTTSVILGIAFYARHQGSAWMETMQETRRYPTNSDEAWALRTDSTAQLRDNNNNNVPDLLPGEPADISELPVEEATLTAAPYVPPSITRDYSVLLRVPLTTSTRMTQLTSQYKYEQWNFNGTVPGPFIRARVGDVVELSLTNHDTTGNPHNIDCHAFLGPGGGSALTTTEEGETKTARFRLLCPGLYVYHCAAAPVPVHIANGMYGLMYVQSAEGDLPPVDHEYYVMQSEFYHEPPEVDENGRPSREVDFSYPNALREEPSVVVFNGHESALTRDKPLKSLTDESIRIFFGNAGPNLTSSFHVIGSNFQRVYRDGDVMSTPGQFVQTLNVPPGGTMVADMKMLVPGTYTLVDHAIFRLDKGAVGYLNVAGKPRPDIYQSSQPPSPCVGCKLHP